ncbi:carboxypeptidase-like regulatory domain-containing protein [Hyunsoonleella flava]|uniref:Carboxypeptidase-like regulatory domain-containing protein n=1 Tax=Hyunsoonleella flava TaxID=2527939 RepID=A0A4Q9FI55_9FLAO|nr:carboxypeptidase-like regulatory domain-containing protein [Hyunsoonleella flava]TBN05493.1 carboxypeptidase-like regulatory domain-containing protein [Hyunsoonleella flava]
MQHLNQHIFASMLVLLVCFNIFAQRTIKGKVLDNESPLEGASVYLNNTTTGTITNSRGEFTLEVESGHYDLIISFLGYQTVNYPFYTETVNDSLIFKLKEQPGQLDEVVIKKTVYDDIWHHNLKYFKDAFLGKTEFSKNCDIQNPKILHFDYDNTTNTFTADARGNLQIKNEALGYEISYELVHFEIIENYLTYLGYAFFKPLKGGKRKQKQWAENRLVAYNGSNIHFYKSALNDELDEAGFIVNQFRRVPNEERPTDEQIAKARAVLKASRNTITYSKKIDTPKTVVDSALVVIRKQRLPKFKDYLYKSGLKASDIISPKNGVPVLGFKDNISVVYTREKEELAYIRRDAFSRPRAPVAQTSAIIPLKQDAVLDKIGILVNPLDVTLEGYWSFEKFANTLPLDYEPVALD